MKFRITGKGGDAGTLDGKGADGWIEIEAVPDDNDAGCAAFSFGEPVRVSGGDGTNHRPISGGVAGGGGGFFGSFVARGGAGGAGGSAGPGGIGGAGGQGGEAHASVSMAGFVADIGALVKVARVARELRASLADVDEVISVRSLSPLWQALDELTEDIYARTTSAAKRAAP